MWLSYRTFMFYFLHSYYIAIVAQTSIDPHVPCGVKPIQTIATHSQTVPVMSCGVLCVVSCDFVVTVMTFSCSKSICTHCVGLDWPTHATNTFYFTSLTHFITDNVQGGVFIHTLTHVQHGYNDIRLHNTKLHNTIT